MQRRHENVILGYMKLGSWNKAMERPNNLCFLTNPGSTFIQEIACMDGAKKGAVMHRKLSIQKPENFSILPAINMDRYLACIICNSVNVDSFASLTMSCLRCAASIQDLIWPLLDNAAIHRTEVEDVTF